MARATRRVPQDVATQIVSISPVPVYGNNSNFRRVGTMGGYIAPIDEMRATGGSAGGAPAPR